MAGFCSPDVPARSAGLAIVSTPWWYSGEEPADGDAPRDDEAPQIPAWDPSAILLVANQLVDWATERFVAPHAEHDDPAEYPSCVLCRSVSVLGGLTPDSGALSEPVTMTPVTWIPVRRVIVEE